MNGTIQSACLLYRLCRCKRCQSRIIFRPRSDWESYQHKQQAEAETTSLRRDPEHSIPNEDAPVSGRPHGASARSARLFDAGCWLASSAVFISQTIRIGEPNDVIGWPLLRPSG